MLVVAFNYGARQEIARAARRLAASRGRPALAVDAVTADQLATLPRHARSARSRPHHPHQRRAAAVQFPALAGGLQRARVRAGLLAGFRPRRARERDRRISPPRAPFRRPCRARPGRDVAGTDQPSARGRELAAASSRCGYRSALVLAPLAIGAAYLGGWPSRCSGASRRSSCSGNGSRWSPASTADRAMAGGAAIALAVAAGWPPWHRRWRLSSCSPSACSRRGAGAGRLRVWLAAGVLYAGAIGVRAGRAALRHASMVSSR